jgi:hypothetical protein
MLYIATLYSRFLYNNLEDLYIEEYTHSPISYIYHYISIAEFACDMQQIKGPHLHEM